VERLRTRGARQTAAGPWPVLWWVGSTGGKALARTNDSTGGGKLGSESVAKLQGRRAVSKFDSFGAEVVVSLHFCAVPVCVGEVVVPAERNRAAEHGHSPLLYVLTAVATPRRQLCDPELIELKIFRAY
jgi:hypothetical protein